MAPQMFAVIGLAVGSRIEFRLKSGGLSVYRDGLYCGPGWGFTADDVASGKIRELPGAFDAIDQACQLHDQCYGDHGYFALQCDAALKGRLAIVVFSADSTPAQRFDAVVIAAYFVVQVTVIGLPTAAYRFIHERIENAFRAGARMIDVIERELAWHAYQVAP